MNQRIYTSVLSGYATTEVPTNEVVDTQPGPKTIQLTKKLRTLLKLPIKSLEAPISQAAWDFSSIAHDICHLFGGFKGLDSSIIYVSG